MRPLVEQHFDGELHDPASGRRVEAHLTSCAACAAERAALQALDDALRGLPAPEPSQMLRESVRGLLAHQIEPQRSLSPARPRRLAVLGSMAAALVLGGVWLWHLATTNPQDEAQTLAVFVEDHVASVQRDSAVSVTTGDAAAMERWFAARLDFAPRLPRWAEAELIAGRLCLIGGKRVARVRYHLGETELSLFVQRVPEEGARLMPSVSKAEGVAMPAVTSVRGHRVACWQEDELEYVLVAPASPAEVFQRLGITG
jgi:anti-sigma factor RsiW